MLTHWVDFFDELQNVRGRSPNTIMAYRHDLELYESFLKSHKKIQLFYDFLTKNNLSARSQARVVSSARTYLKFCERHGDKAPHLRQLRPPRVRATLPKPTTLAEFEKLYQVCNGNDVYTTARNQITLLLLFGVGCRVSELIALDVSDFNVTEGWLKILGKGNKERLVPLTKFLQDELANYLRKARPRLVRKPRTRSILVNDRGHRPSRVDLWRWFRLWSGAAGLSTPISPHKLRHGCATSLLEGGADLRSIQMLLGHASIQSTRIYTNVTVKKIRDEVDKHHPLSGLRIDSDA